MRKKSNLTVQLTRPVSALYRPEGRDKQQGKECICKTAAGTQLSIPTHAQLQRHRLKFIKKPSKNSYMFRSTTIIWELQCPR